VLPSGLVVIRSLCVASRCEDEDVALLRALVVVGIQRPDPDEPRPQPVDLILGRPSRHHPSPSALNGDLHVGLVVEVLWPRIGAFTGRTNVAHDEIRAFTEEEHRGRAHLARPPPDSRQKQDGPADGQP
jgi:hypothetical protein